MNSIKGAHELQQKISRVEQEGMEEKTTDIPPCYHSITLINEGRVHKLQALRSGYAGTRVIRKQPNEHVKWSQVACTSKYVCIDKSN